MGADSLTLGKPAGRDGWSLWEVPSSLVRPTGRAKVKIQVSRLLIFDALLLDHDVLTCLVIYVGVRKTIG